MNELSINKIISTMKNIPIETVSIICNNGEKFNCNINDIIMHTRDGYIKLNQPDMKKNIYIGIDTISVLKKQDYKIIKN
jgi:hypothetical protein